MEKRDIIAYSVMVRADHTDPDEVDKVCTGAKKLTVIVWIIQGTDGQVEGL
jgi:hypothetical protein